MQAQATNLGAPDLRAPGHVNRRSARRGEGTSPAPARSRRGRRRRTHASLGSPGSPRAEIIRQPARAEGRAHEGAVVLSGLSKGRDWEQGNRKTPTKERNTMAKADRTIIDEDIKIVSAPNSVFTANPVYDENGNVVDVHLTQIVAIAVTVTKYSNGEADYLNEFINADGADDEMCTAFVDAQGFYTIPCCTGRMTKEQMIKEWNSECWKPKK